MEAEKLGRRWHGTSNPRQHMRPPAHRHSLLDATFHSHEQTGLEARSGLCLCMPHVAAWRMLLHGACWLAGLLCWPAGLLPLKNTRALQGPLLKTHRPRAPPADTPQRKMAQHPSTTDCTPLISMCCGWRGTRTHLGQGARRWAGLHVHPGRRRLSKNRGVGCLQDAGCAPALTLAEAILAPGMLKLGHEGAHPGHGLALDQDVERGHAATSTPADRGIGGPFQSFCARPASSYRTAQPRATLGPPAQPQGVTSAFAYRPPSHRMPHCVCACVCV